MRKRIVVIDDEEEFKAGIAKSLRELPCVKERFEVITPSYDDIVKEYLSIRNRYISFRKGEKSSGDSTLFDTADILIVDWDLLKLAETTGLMKANQLVYIVRFFSECGIILAVNRLGTNPFDLALGWNTHQLCDYDLGYRQIANAGLWGGDGDEFKPWYWPDLPSMTDRIDRRVGLLEERFDKPILENLGLHDQAKHFPEELLIYLGEKPFEATFRSFIESSGNCIARKDTSVISAVPDSFKMKAAAHLIGRWLELIVLPLQDTIIDAPHLAARYPSLLEADPDDIGSWNGIASKSPSDAERMLSDSIEEFRFAGDLWLQRKTWFFRRIMSSDKVLEVKDPFSRKSPRFAFCEDASRFRELGSCSEYWLKDMPTPYKRRYLSPERPPFTEVEYLPPGYMVKAQEGMKETDD